MANGQRGKTGLAVRQVAEKEMSQESEHVQSRNRNTGDPLAGASI